MYTVVEKRRDNKVYATATKVCATFTEFKQFVVSMGYEPEQDELAADFVAGADVTYIVYADELSH